MCRWLVINASTGRPAAFSGSATSKRLPQRACVNFGPGWRLAWLVPFSGNIGLVVERLAMEHQPIVGMSWLIWCALHGHGGG
jgi:hypothetical protein